MAKIKNMGTATMRFNEGIVVSGSIDTSYASQDGVAIVCTGSVEISGNGTNDEVLRVITNSQQKDIVFVTQGTTSTPAEAAFLNGNSSGGLRLQDPYSAPGDGSTFILNDGTSFTYFIKDDISSQGPNLANKVFIKRDASSFSTMRDRIIGAINASGVTIYDGTNGGSAEVRYYNNSIANRADITAIENGSFNGGINLTATTAGSSGNSFYFKANFSTLTNDSPLNQDQTFSGGTDAVTGTAQSVKGTLYLDSSEDLNLSGSNNTVLVGGENGYVLVPSNSVGIGTTSPETDLHVSGALYTTITVGDGLNKSTYFSSISTKAFYGDESVTGSFGSVSTQGGAGYVQLGSLSDHDVKFVVNNSAKMIVSASGDIGIGTSTPDSRLHVNDTSGTTQIIIGDNATQNELSEIILKSSNQSNNVQSFIASSDTSGGGSVGSVGTIGSHDFQIKTNSAIRAVVDAGGNTRVENDAYVLGDLYVTGTFRPNKLGINTTKNMFDGQMIIERVGSVPTFSYIRSSSAVASSDLPDDNNTIFGSLVWNSSDDSYAGTVAVASIQAKADRDTWNYASDKPTSIVFNTGQEDSSLVSERMRITSRGRLGIGNPGPAFTLHVERTGSASTFPELGIVRRGKNIDADKTLGMINFSIRGGTDDELPYFTPAQILARNIQIVHISDDENEAFVNHGVGSELVFRTTVSGSTTAANAAILTSDKEWECDTLRGLSTEVSNQRIKFDFDNIDVPIGPNIDVRKRIDFFGEGDTSGVVRYATFMANFNTFTEDLVDGDIVYPRQPNRAYFNPDSNADFQFRFDSANGGALLTMTSSATTTGNDGQINMGSSTNAGNGYVNIWKPVASSLSADLAFNNVSDTSADRDMFISFYNQTIENARIITKRNSGDSFDADFTIRTRTFNGATATSNFADRFMITKSGSILLHENDLSNTDASSIDTSLFVSGTIGLSGNAAKNSVFGGDVIVSGSLDIKQQASFEDYMIISVTADNTDIQVGAAQAVFRAPFAMELYQPPRASLTTAATTLTTVDIHVDGTTIMDETASGSRLRIDGTESTSRTASTACVLTNTSINDDAQIRIDVDTAGTGGRGLKVTLYYRRAL